MAFARPTLPELVSRIQLDLVSRLSLVGAVLRRSFVYVLARVFAGAAHMLHGHLDFLARQLFPDQSEAEFLERQAALFGLTRNPPTYARCIATFTGAVAFPNVLVPAGTIYTSAAGYRYETIDDYDTVDAGDGVAWLDALTPGAASTPVVGQVLSLESPIPGVVSVVTVNIVGGTTDTWEGTDEETTDALRARLLERLASQPHGGTADDYIAWSKEVTGVTRVWVFPLELGPGTVLVRFVRDDDLSPIPDAGEVSALQVYLNGKKPAHVAVTVAAPVQVPRDLAIAITPDNPGRRTLVEAELADWFRREMEPGSTVLVSALRTVIGSTEGITDYTLTSPIANVTHAVHELPTLGNITWV